MLGFDQAATLVKRSLPHGGGLNIERRKGPGLVRLSNAFLVVAAHTASTPYLLSAIFRNEPTSRIMKIAIGTQSQYKINAILRTFSELDIAITYTTHNVDSGVSEQPMNDEVRQGSINRAERALAGSADADIGIGAEFGYVEVGEPIKMLCYAAIADRSGNHYAEHSSSLELPLAMVEALRNDIQIHTLVSETLDKVKPRPLNWSFSDRMTKRRLISECSTNVMLRFLLNDELY